MLLSMTPSSSSPFSSAVTCSSARDLVAAAPFLLGYTVTNSVVVILLSRKRSRGAFRIAIPEPTSVKSKLASSGSQDAVYKEVAQTLAGMVRELRDIDQIALLYYTAQAITTPDTLPGTDLIKVCQAEVSLTGRETVEAVCVSETSWASYHPDGSTPLGGHPLTEVRNSDVALECTARIDRPIDNLSHVAQLPEVWNDVAAAVHRSCHRASPWPRQTQDPTKTVTDITSITPLWREINLGSPAQTKHTIHAKLIAAIQREEHWLNAAFVASLTTDGCLDLITESLDLHGVTMREFLMRAPSGKLFDTAVRQRILSTVLAELGNERPDTTHLRLFCEYLGTLCAYAPSRLQPQIQALRVFSWWLLGMTGVATDILKRTETHPHRNGHVCFLHVVADLIAARQHPAWILREHNSAQEDLAA